MPASQLCLDLPADVAPVVASLLAALDQAMPGAVEGFYLLGSVALGDYWPGESDVDFLAVIDPGADLSPLAGTHLALARSFPQVRCDGIYVTPEELALPPDGLGPAARDGVLTYRSRDERHPVTWLTLLRHGLVARGRMPSPDWIAADVAAAIGYSRDNLARYWSPWPEQRRAPHRDHLLSLLTDSGVIWGCLGVSRLHAAITAGSVLSKSAAGEHAKRYFPAHRPIIDEAVRLRRGEITGYASPDQRAEALVAFMDDVIGAVP